MFKFPPIKKHSFTPCIRIWKLKNPDIANQFCVDFNLKFANATTNSDDCVESAWALLKESLLEAATMTCGLSKNINGYVKPGGGITKLLRLSKNHSSITEHCQKKAEMVRQKKPQCCFWYTKSEAGENKFGSVSVNGNGIFRMDG